MHIVPCLSTKLWSTLIDRLQTPPTVYMRRMGMGMVKRPVPECTLDQFFMVAASVTQSYVSSIDAELIELWTPSDSNDCRTCGSTRIAEGGDGNTCTACGESVAMLKMVNTEPICTYGTNGGRRATAYVYKRLNHFIDHLRRVQGRESSSIRPEIINAVRAELAKERIHDGDARITTVKVRAILKRLRLQKHYVHVFLIASRLSGRSAPTMTPAQEEKLLTMFADIQEPFERHCPPHRSNMVSYAFVIRKLCEVLGWFELAAYFPLLKSRAKVVEQDRIWEKICGDLGYKFQRSIA
jgi:hypothetical protein